MRQMVTTSARWGARRKSGSAALAACSKRRRRRDACRRCRPPGRSARPAAAPRRRRARPRSAGGSGWSPVRVSRATTARCRPRATPHRSRARSCRARRGGSGRTASSRAWRGSPCAPVWTPSSRPTRPGTSAVALLGQIDEPRLGRCAGAAPQRHLDGQPRLADTTRAEQGHDGRLAEGEDPLDVVGAPDGRRRRRGHTGDDGNGRGGFLRADLADELVAAPVDRADEALRRRPADGGERS